MSLCDNYSLAIIVNFGIQCDGYFIMTILNDFKLYFSKLLERKKIKFNENFICHISLSQYC